MKSHKIAYVMLKIISGWGSAQTPLEELTTLPQSRKWAEDGVNFLPIHLPLNAPSSLATQVQCASPKTIFWIRPCAFASEVFSSMLFHCDLDL